MITKVDETQKVGDVKTPTPPDATPKSYTQEELDHAVQSQDTKTGRELKTAKETLETLNTNYAALQTENKSVKASIKELQEAQFKNDPAQLSAYRARASAQEQADIVAAKEADLAKREAALSTAKEAADKIVRDTLETHFTGLGINPVLLKGMATLSNENFEAVCKTMTAGKVPMKRLDSGRTEGGTDFASLAPEQKIAHALEK